MPRKKAPEDTYVRLVKTITHPRVVGGIKDLAQEMLMTNEEAAYHLIREGAEKQLKKKIQNSMYGGLRN